MDATVTPTVQELLAWISDRSRTYDETMDAWRSNCPRVSAWEDALLAGLVDVVDGRVVLTAHGRIVRAQIGR